jgi:hypothetical protein
MLMADRSELLRRLVEALQRPGVDGVLGTADVLEDLLLLGALEGKIAVGSMNRGGLKDAVFEADDRFTSCDAATIEAMGFDGGKMLCRIDLEDPSTAATLEACGQAVTSLAARRLPAVVEPFLCRRAGRRLVNDLSPAAVAFSMAVASGLGATSAYTWLKVPAVADMSQVAEATTLPLLLLGGDPQAAPDEIFRLWEQALMTPGVRGLVVGRALLYPPDGDVAAAIDTAARLVHPELWMAPAATTKGNR